MNSGENKSCLYCHEACNVSKKLIKSRINVKHTWTTEPNEHHLESDYMTEPAMPPAGHIVYNY